MWHMFYSLTLSPSSRSVVICCFDYSYAIIKSYLKGNITYSSAGNSKYVVDHKAVNKAHRHKAFGGVVKVSKWGHF